MDTAVGYFRVSTEEQTATGLGLADQADRIRAYCALRGLTLAEIIQDGGVSGGRPLAHRPGGARLLRALNGTATRGRDEFEPSRAGRAPTSNPDPNRHWSAANHPCRRSGRERAATHVIMLKLDRGFRNAADCLATVEAWDKRRVTLHIIDLGGNAIDTASAAGKFMLTVLAGAAEMERNLTRERTRAALRIKRQRGQRISRFAPFGYRLTPQATLEPEAAEQRAVQMMCGLHARGRSLRQIAAALHEVGHRGRRGGPISPKTVRAILRRCADPPGASTGRPHQ
ncbi:MAG: recombinase family protein [Phycisphaerae bacterium]|nr:recombinase family protein [Phycisphaerae bacterium]